MKHIILLVHTHILYTYIYIYMVYQNVCETGMTQGLFVPPRHLDFQASFCSPCSARDMLHHILLCPAYTIFFCSSR